jgi:hypothetical protein
MDAWHCFKLNYSKKSKIVRVDLEIWFFEIWKDVKSYDAKINIDLMGELETSLDSEKESLSFCVQIWNNN